MTKSEFENKLKAIPEVEPDAEDLELLKIAGRTEYNGKISLRVPKSLHKELLRMRKKKVFL